MAIPDFQTIMLPLLQLLADGQIHFYSEVVAAMEGKFSLTEEERRLASERTGARVFENRVGWAGTHLKTAGLLTRPARGSMQITDAGMDMLSKQPDSVSMKLLREQSKTYKDYYSGRTKKLGESSTVPQPEESDSRTPEELIDQGYAQLMAALKDQIREQLSTMDPFQFERLVIRLLKAMGYGGSGADMHKALAVRGDGGVDGWIKEDQLGLSMLYVQAKRHQENVQRPDLQKFVGALEERHSAKGIFITTADYSKGVHEYLQRVRHQVVLINGETLAGLMFENNVGVLPTGDSFVKKVLDPTVFDPEQTA